MITYKEPCLIPPQSLEWKPLRRQSAGPMTVHIEQRDPAELRVSIDVGFAAIVAVGVEDASDLMAGFSLADADRVSCHRYAFVLDEFGEGDDRRVVYRDKAGEVRLTRPDYDRVAGIVSDLLADPFVQSLFEEAQLRHALLVHASAWQPFRPEA